jgi:hypothetical protein
LLTRYTCLATGLVGLWLAVALAGCNYSAPDSPLDVPPGGTFDGDADPNLGANKPGGSLPSTSPPLTIEGEHKRAILENVIKLIQTAALKPGGDNFKIATENLNQYFSDTRPSDYLLASEARAFLLQHMPAGTVKDLENPAFRMPDARHIEDCMLYHSIAIRIGGTGDDLTRVRRVFRWIMEQIELVPPGSLGAPGLGQAYARPYDVLMRGMATEDDRGWAERGWLFMVLCRQLGVDVGLLTYTPPGGKEAAIWTCAALIDGKLYLFDTRIGLEVPRSDPVPGVDDAGVATLDEALGDPSVLGRLDLPGLSSYGTSRATLLGSSSKIGLQLDSSPGYRAPKMAMLQGSLAGKNRTILYRDPVDERDRFAKALGERSGGIGFWELPAFVEDRLFNDPRFVKATQHALMLFDPNYYPLVYARIKQLRGEIPEAIEDYVAFRKPVNPMMMDKRTVMPQEQQQALDIYATYFLALCHLEQAHPNLAEDFFKATLRLLPAPGRGQPYYHMFRWGAQANLARLCEAKGDAAQAIAYYTELDPTAQQHGNFVRARALVWSDPTAPPAPPLPPAPTPKTPPPFLLAAPPGK